MTSMKALAFDAFGDAGVLRYREIDEPVLGAGQALIRMKAIGLNFADIYRRRGNYHLVGEPPYILGYEGAGVIAAINLEGVRRRVIRLVIVWRLRILRMRTRSMLRFRWIVSFRFRMTSRLRRHRRCFLQGLTAQYLLRDSHRLVEGESVLGACGGGGRGFVSDAAGEE